MSVLKKYLLDILAVVLFAVIAFAYFMPADLEGRILYRHDSSAGRGAGQEALEYLHKTGERTRWTNSTFSGMPTYQTAPSYKSTDVLKQAVDAYHLWLPENVWYVFVYLLGFYILLRAFDFRQYLAMLGAVIWAFSSYFFIIIAAGHIWKVMALAYLPPMIGGIVLAYRGKYLWGFIVTSIFAAFEVYANHVQMTYYYLFVIFFMVIAFLVEAIRQKQLARFLKATAVCAVAAAFGICVNLSNLYHTWQYQKESMRGKSELVKANNANQTDSGLERDYITQWSYGIGETWTLLVPNTKGGASIPLSQNEKAMQKADNTYLFVYQQLGQYWGEQPMTSGPVYVGAFVLMLFVLGLFIVKGPMKWALLAATILSIMLSWGKNFMGLTDFFIDYMPMYSKFRTVASILVIAEFTIPLLAMLALKEVVQGVVTGVSGVQGVQGKRLWKYIGISFALTAGICLLFALMPGVFFPDYVSSQEMRALSQFPQEHLNPLLANLRSMRQSIFVSDCWRSFSIILMGTLLLALFLKKKLKAEYMIGGVLVLCLVDMWMVNKRYLNDDMFVEKSVREMPQQKTATDELILQDKSLDYRVLNLSTNTFNENETSYYHKSIGGYHAAKLRRYQELIEEHLQGEMGRLNAAVVETGGHLEACNGDSLFHVLNMLNTKYVILPLKDNGKLPVQNPWAQGNGWFVEQIDYVPDADAEIAALHDADLRTVAVVDKQFESILGTPALQKDTTANSSVELTSYEANRLAYKVKSPKGGIVVFSEIYYPGWTCTIDGQATEIARANYVLRAIKVPEGEHEVIMTFDPQTVHITEAIAYGALALLALMLIVLVVAGFHRSKTKETE